MRSLLFLATGAMLPIATACGRQNGVLFLAHNFGAFGISLSCDVVDSIKRRAAVRELEVAAEVVHPRTEGERIAATCRARAEQLQTQLTHLLTRAELEQTVGPIPGR
jgi:hypothetical protein